MLWIDDFSTDEFAARYRLWTGVQGAGPGLGTFYVDAGLHAGAAGWTDPTDVVGPGLACWVELDVNSWLLGGTLLKIGFLPPAQHGFGPQGAWFQLAHGGPGSGVALELHDGATIVADFYDTGVVVVPDSSPLIMRMAIDDAGVAYMGLSALAGGFAPSGGGFATALGGSGRLSEPTVAALPGYSPAAYMALAGAGHKADLWEYSVGATAKLTPGEIYGQSVPGGIVRSGGGVVGSSP